LSTLDFATVDYFRDSDVAQDPFPYYDWVRQQNPVWREPHHDVVLVTGY
jgi:hypothetical protein